MSEDTLEISFDEIEKEREKYLLVDTRDKVTVEYGMILMISVRSRRRMR